MASSIEKPFVEVNESVPRVPTTISRLDAIRDGSVQTINKRLLLLAVWALMGCVSYGYMAASIGSTLGFPNFYVYYKLSGGADGSSTFQVNIIGLIVGMQSIGGAVGVIVVCLVQERFGRRMGFAFYSIVLLFGAALTAGSRNYTMLIFGRLFAGAGVLATSVYLAELAPATRRGDLAGLIGPGTTAGYLIAGWLSVAFYEVHDSINFRLALIIQVLFPLLTIIGLPFAVESPRWLSLHGRHDEALKVLMKIHHHVDDPNDELAREEAYQIKKQTDLDRKLPSTWTAMFTKYRKRSLLAMLAHFAGQATGIQIVSNFGPRIYQSIGLSPLVSLIVAAGWLCFAFFAQTAWVYPLDRYGRKPSLVMGCAHSTLALAVLIALLALYGPGGSDETNLAGQRAIVFMFFYFLLAFSQLEPAYYLYVTEIFPTALRVKGIAVGLATLNLTAFWGTMSQPAGVKSIGYLVFLCCSFVNTFLLYFFIVETKGVPLEEMPLAFGEAEEVAVSSLQASDREKPTGP